MTHFKKLISFCITSANNEIFSILSIYFKKKQQSGVIALTLMAGRDRLSEVYTTYIKYIIAGFKVVFYWDQPFQPKTVLVDLVEVLNRTLFQPILVEARLGPGIVISRLPRRLLSQRLSTYWQEAECLPRLFFNKWPKTTFSVLV